MAYGFPVTLDAVRTTLAKMMQMDGRTALIRAVDIEGNAVGSIGIFLQGDSDPHNAELAYWLAEPYWGQGIMPAAIQQICDMAFVKFPIQRVFARPYAFNTPSRRVLEKAGFILESEFPHGSAKNGVQVDATIYATYRK